MHSAAAPFRGKPMHTPSECAVMPVGIAYTQNQLAPKSDKSVLDTAIRATHDAPEEHTRATGTRPEEPPRALGAGNLGPAKATSPALFFISVPLQHRQQCWEAPH